VPQTLGTAEWLAFMRLEYLEGFIREGGSTVKFAVPLDSEARAELEEQLPALSGGLLITRIDAESTGVHMIDRVFFRIAEQISWRRLSRQVAIRIIREAGYPLEGNEERSPLEQLAEQTGIDASLLNIELRKAFSVRIFRNPALAKEFRVAMTHPCLAELAGGSEGEPQTR